MNKAFLHAVRTGCWWRTHRHSRDGGRASGRRLGVQLLLAGTSGGHVHFASASIQRPPLTLSNYIGRDKSRNEAGTDTRDVAQEKKNNSYVYVSRNGVDDERRDIR